MDFAGFVVHFEMYCIFEKLRLLDRNTETFYNKNVFQ